MFSRRIPAAGTCRSIILLATSPTVQMATEKPTTDAAAAPEQQEQQEQQQSSVRFGFVRSAVVRCVLLVLEVVDYHASSAVVRDRVEPNTPKF